MRLTAQLVGAIPRAAVEAMGPDVELRLFGARADDRQRGARPSDAESIRGDCSGRVAGGAGGRGSTSGGVLSEPTTMLSRLRWRPYRMCRRARGIESEGQAEPVPVLTPSLMRAEK